MITMNVKERFKTVEKSWKELKTNDERVNWLFNGFLLDIMTLDKMNNLVERVGALKKIKLWREENSIELLRFVDIGVLPEADIAVYDLSDRKDSKYELLRAIIELIVERVNPLEIYMWNPLDNAQNAMDGYKWYSGQKLIVYQLRENELKMHDLVDALRTVVINGYDTNDSSRAVKRVILVLDDWSEMNSYLRFNLGIDTDNGKELFVDAWCGLLHEWTTVDGLVLDNFERLYGYSKDMAKVKPFKREKGRRKLKTPKDLLKKEKKSKIVYLVDTKGTKSAYFDTKIIFPDAVGPVF